jgi:23S rRNA (pseudouridine1915-N3)-methyltransferase
VGRLRFTLFHVGRLKEGFARAGVEHYRKRILTYASVELRALRQEPLLRKAAIEGIRKKEAGRIERILSPSHTVVALDASGQLFTSPRFAQYLDTLEKRGRSDIAFVIGGPVGLSPECIERSHLTLSLSTMTLSHELTVLALMEQLYRALAYLHNHPYPK